MLQDAVLLARKRTIKSFEAAGMVEEAEALRRLVEPEPEETFECVDCGKEYKTEQGFENHVADKHTEEESHGWYDTEH